jgi:hypothetical protein
MIASAIHELAAARGSASIAAVFFDKKIQVWDVKSQKEICEFAAVFQTGARNLALAPNAGMLVAGLSRRLGVVAAYEIPSGKKLWQRKRLIYPSRLQFDSTGQSIFCTVNERRSVLRLEAGSGTTIEEIHGISERIEGPYGGTLIVPAKEKQPPRFDGRQGTDGTWHIERLSVPDEKKKSPLRLIAGSHNFAVDRLEFAPSYATFSPHAVFFTEGWGPVRCFSCDHGKLQWMFDPGTDSHVQRVHYSPRLNAFFGGLRNFNNKHNRRLLRFDVPSGACERVCDLDWDAWDVAFLDVADQLVTTSGEIRNLSDGALVGRLAFPQREYPDK